MTAGIGQILNKGSMDATTGSPTIRVEIYNQTYNIRSDGDTEYIIQLAEFVDSRMREISSGTLTVDSLKVAILAALHIADELHRLKNMHEQADSQLAARSSECAEMLDKLLKVRSSVESEQGANLKSSIFMLISVAAEGNVLRCSSPIYDD
jgi:cell division protein ZapA